MKIDSDVRVLSFNDESHFNNHLNYLFRTDFKQKWTNNITKLNTYAIPDYDNDGNITLWPTFKRFPEALANRKNIVKLILQTFKKSHMTWKDLGFSRIDCMDSYEVSFSKDMLYEVLDWVRGFNNKYKDKIKVLFVVTHEDQLENYLHFHIVLYKMP